MDVTRRDLAFSTLGILPYTKGASLAMFPRVVQTFCRFCVFVRGAGGRCIPNFPAATQSMLTTSLRANFLGLAVLFLIRHVKFESNSCL